MRGATSVYACILVRRRVVLRAVQRVTLYDADKRSFLELNVYTPPPPVFAK